jgi:hypothetical protein
MADQKFVVVNGVGTYVDLSAVELAQRAADQAAADAAAIVTAAAATRLQGLSTDSEYLDFVTQLQGKTAAQVKNYVQTNVTDLTSAKILLAKVLLYIARTM